MAEQRLIDANKLRQAMDGTNEYATLCRWQILEVIDRQPTVDAVPFEFVKEYFEEIDKKVNLLAEKVGCNVERKDGDHDDIAS